MFVRRSGRHSGRHGLVEERHWEVAEVEKPRFNRLSFPKLLKNPLSRLFREPALACAADDYRDGHHMFPSLLDDGLLSFSDRCLHETTCLEESVDEDVTSK